MSRLDKLADDPRYRDIVTRRRRLTLALTLCALCAALGFCLVSVLQPALLTRTVGDDSVIPIGLVVCEAILFVALAIVCGYAWYMNRKLTPMIEQIVSEFES